MTAKRKKAGSPKKQEDILRGQRIKILRGMAGISAEELAAKAEYSRPTISFWESARNPLSKKAANRLIEAIKTFDIDCNFTWLWEGSGNRPSFKGSISILTSESVLPSFQKEIDLFLQLNTNSVIFKVDSTSYRPAFEYNDIVGGIWQPIDTLRADCFALIKIDEMIQLKWIKKISKNNNEYYEARAYPDDQAEAIEIEQFAPITRVWRF